MPGGDLMTLADRLHACHSSVVHDVMKDLGLPLRVLPRTIVGLEPTMKAAGPVFTIRGRPDPTMDKHTSLYWPTVTRAGRPRGGVPTTGRHARAVRRPVRRGFEAEGRARLHCRRRLPRFCRNRDAKLRIARWRLRIRKPKSRSCRQRTRLGLQRTEADLS